MSTIDDLAAAREPEVATTMKDGTPGFVRFWTVRVGDDIYARSFKGPSGAWYTSAIERGRTTLRIDGREIPVTVEMVGPELREEIDGAYEAKYGANPSDREYVVPMLLDGAVATTVRLKPEE